ncbi:hypothetical protein ACIQTW_05575 [Paenarthrobacter sp. NPDC090517]|uniref:hypothetical protein n=1 Tax=Paenarthrobacter sp. NPDC090517 TaxID=3364381 RepID=UPI00381A6730
MKGPRFPQSPATGLGPPTFLERASLLVLVAAVIAGIFGMHVVTGSHGTHPANSESPVVAAESALHVHDTVQFYGSSRLHGSSPADADKCTSGSCSCTEAAATNCIPALQTGSLAAPPPTAAVGVIPASQELHVLPRSWSYQPLGPTPLQLCISRT